MEAPRRKVSLADSNAGRLDARGRGGEAFLRGAALALSLARRQADLFFRGLNAGNGAFIAALGAHFRFSEWAASFPPERRAFEGTLWKLPNF
ncbi:MAG: hypothetical protein BHW65_02540 [Verrucomicrobia bacterium CAG:312_58_20]|nr:MAG: hypothetical protein BHW65_02540 [Verrucomicrobia bacterium CAG:312_58_20]